MTPAPEPEPEPTFQPLKPARTNALPYRIDVRNKRVELVDEALVETDIVPSEEDVHDEFDTIRKHMGIKSWRGKFVKRNYVFGEEDIPKGESIWMKVVYSFAGQSVHQYLCFHDFKLWAEKSILNNAWGPNISRIMGTNTSAFELLVLKRKIMGPCWINIKHPVVDNKGVSFRFSSSS